MIMKKNIFKLFSAMVVSATVLTGCIEEVFPKILLRPPSKSVRQLRRLRLQSVACRHKWYKAIWYMVAKPMKPTLAILR